MATIELKVGKKTQSDFALGEYMYTKPEYKEIDVEAKGSIVRDSDWNSHYLKELKITISSPSSKRLHFFDTHWCSKTNSLELHIATSESSARMPRTKYSRIHSSTQLDLNPTIPRPEVKIVFVIYIHDGTTIDRKVYKCGKFNNEKPPFVFETDEPDTFISDGIKKRVENNDPQPDTDNGNVLVGKSNDDDD